MARCTRCGGTGNVVIDRNGRQGGVIETETCPVCGGGGEVPDEDE